MHVDAIGEHRKRLGQKLQFALFAFRRAWPEERSLLQAFAHEPQTRAIPVEDFEQTPPFVGKDEERATAHILFELLHHEGVQRVAAGTQIAGVEREEDFETAREAQHEVCRALRSWAASADWAGLVRRSFTPPGSSSSRKTSA